MRLTTRRARRARALVESRRCPKRPSITHDYEFWQSGAVDPFCSVFVKVYRCVKCGNELEVPE